MTSETKSIKLIPKPDTDDVSIIEFDYICNDTFDDNWLENTKKVLIKSFAKLHIHKFLKLVFSNLKTQLYIKQDKELSKICLERCNLGIENLYGYYLQNAPQRIIDLVNTPSYTTNLQAQVDVFKYILTTFKKHDYIQIFKDLIHYRSLLDLMCKQ